EKFKAAKALSSGAYIEVREQRRRRANAEIRSGFCADFSNILLKVLFLYNCNITKDSNLRNLMKVYLL
ncbi:MAG: hypothetical protein PWQ96_1474, partial [Clostridia bacterium]|nr:hypothetical protein [Clostridia bacterium]